MEITETSLIPENLQIHCAKCRSLLDVSIEILRENRIIKCHACGFAFAPNIDVEALLKLMKEMEDSMLASDLIM